MKTQKKIIFHNRQLNEKPMMSYEQMRQRLYADSPYNLATAKDDAYRNGVDEALELMESNERAIAKAKGEV